MKIFKAFVFVVLVAQRCELGRLLDGILRVFKTFDLVDYVLAS